MISLHYDNSYVTVDLDIIAANYRAIREKVGVQWPYCLNLPRAVSIDSPLPMVLFINRVYVCVCVCARACVCSVVPDSV